MIGIIGKSGQFPLHTWLPDAMAGPTPVSALIHAATMVVAGVYLGARLYPVFFNGFSIAAGGMNMMALIGGVTILIGAALAFVQNDIKKVLAYSTISQLGYMVMALGVGAWVAAVFHLFTHAFFKALLFLGAGSVSHARHAPLVRHEGGDGWAAQVHADHVLDLHDRDARARRHLPARRVLVEGRDPRNAGQSGFDTFLVIGLIGAFLTAAYMTRCVYLTFFGEYRGHAHPHESERAITMPLIDPRGPRRSSPGFVNASAVRHREVRRVGRAEFAFPELVHAEFDYAERDHLGVARGRSASASRRSSGSVARSRRRSKGLTERNKAAHAGYTFLENKYYLDHLYEDVIVDGIRGRSRGPRTGSTSTSSTASSTAPGAAPRAPDGSRTTYVDQRGRRRRGQRPRRRDR